RSFVPSRKGPRRASLRGARRGPFLRLCPTQRPEIITLPGMTNLSETGTVQADVDRLAKYLLRHWGHEIQGDDDVTAVGVVIRLLDRHRTVLGEVDRLAAWLLRHYL